MKEELANSLCLSPPLQKIKNKPEMFVNVREVFLMNTYVLIQTHITSVTLSRAYV